MSTARIEAPDESADFVVADICPVAGVPVTVAAAVMRAIADALDANGYDAIYKEHTGLGRVWARPKPVAPDRAV